MLLAIYANYERRRKSRSLVNSQIQVELRVRILVRLSSSFPFHAVFLPEIHVTLILERRSRLKRRRIIPKPASSICCRAVFDDHDRSLLYLPSKPIDSLHHALESSNSSRHQGRSSRTYCCSKSYRQLPDPFIRCPCRCSSRLETSDCSLRAGWHLRFCFGTVS